MKGLDVIRYEGEGYKPMVDFESWRVAYIRYAQRFDRANIKRLERHLLTDEIFVLLKGTATLIMGEEMEECPMDPGVICNVRKGVWHGIYVSRDALVLIVENANTGIANTEYREIKDC